MLSNESKIIRGGRMFIIIVQQYFNSHQIWKKPLLFDHIVKTISKLYKTYNHFYFYQVGTFAIPLLPIATTTWSLLKYM